MKSINQIWLTVITIGGLFLAAAHSRAALVATDLNTGGTESGFSGNWVGSGNVFITQSTDLVYTNYNITQTGTLGGVYASNTSHGDRMDSRNLATEMSGEIWFSALVYVTSGSAFAGLAFDSDPTTGGDERYSHGLSELRIVLTPTSLLVDIDGGALTAIGTETGTFAADTTHLILGRMTVSTGNDTLDVWVDPNVNAAGGPSALPTPNFTSAAFTELDFMDSVSRVGVPIVWDGVNSSYVDAIRLSDTTTAFTDVTGVIIVPEPSATLLGGFGALLLLRRRRDA